MAMNPYCHELLMAVVLCDYYYCYLIESRMNFKNKMVELYHSLVKIAIERQLHEGRQLICDMVHRAGSWDSVAE